MLVYGTLALYRCVTLTYAPDAAGWNLSKRDVQDTLDRKVDVPAAVFFHEDLLRILLGQVRRVIHQFDPRDLRDAPQTIVRLGADLLFLVLGHVEKRPLRGRELRDFHRIPPAPR